LIENIKNTDVCAALRRFAPAQTARRKGFFVVCFLVLAENT